MIDIIVTEPNKTDAIRVFTHIFGTPETAMLCIRHQDENSIVLDILEPSLEDREATQKEREFLTYIITKTAFYDMTKHKFDQKDLDEALEEAEELFWGNII